MTGRVLIVGHDPDNRDITAAVLEWHGWHAESSPTAENALERLKSDRFDVLITAFPQTLASGLSLTEAVRRDPQLKSVRIVNFSADVFDDQVHASVRAGADLVIAMPMAPRLFVERIEELLGGQNQS